MGRPGKAREAGVGGGDGCVGWVGGGVVVGMGSSCFQLAGGGRPGDATETVPQRDAPSCSTESAGRISSRSSLVLEHTLRVRAHVRAFDA